MTPIRWTEAARADLRAIRAFIARDSPVYARRTVDRVKRAVDRLGRFPESGAAVPGWDRADLREVVVGNFRVIYRTSGREVVILTVIHASRDLAGDEDDA